MTDLHELSRNLQNATYPGHEFAQAVREVVAAIVERMEPASEGAKVECPNCGEKTSENHEVVQSDGLEGGRRLFFYTCQQRINELEDRHNRMASLEYQEKVKADMARRAVEIGVDRLVGISAFPVGNCPTCGDLVAPWNKHAKYEGGYTCKPAQPGPTTADRIAADLAAGTFRGLWPEPAAPEAPAERAGNGDVQGEIPEAVKMAIYQLRQNVRLWQLYGEQPASEVDRKTADALESWWRSRSQPVGITEELESVLRSAKEYEMAVRTGTRVEWHAYDADRIGASIAAVRSQYRRKG